MPLLYVFPPIVSRVSIVSPASKNSKERHMVATSASTPPPKAKHQDHTVYFGKVEGENRGSNPIDPPLQRNDPLFWLRDDERKNPAVLAHLQEEKAYFDSKTADLKELIETIYDEHISHIEENDVSAPYKHGPYYYYQRDVAGKSYKIYCRCALDAEPGEVATEEIILDVNQLGDGKPFCDVHGVFPSPTHELIAYSVDFVGDEVYTIYIVDKDGNEVDAVKGTNGSLVWGADSQSFFYTTKDATLRDDKIWRHIIGKSCSEDVCVYHEGDPLFSVGADKSSDGNTLLLCSVSSETTEYHLLDLQKGATHNELTTIQPRKKGVRYFVEMHGTEKLIICTNENKAFNNKIVVADRSAPTVVESVLAPHNEEVLIEGHGVMKNFIVVYGRRDGLTRLWVILLHSSGSFIHEGANLMREVPMDEKVFSAEPLFSHMKEYSASTFRMTYSSLTTPLTVFDVDPVSFAKTAVKVKFVGGGFNALDYKVERLLAPAPDGAEIPISLVYHKSLEGFPKPCPCMLYGYGSYGLCMDPDFSIRYLPYIDRGMVYAIAHIRGGSEMGRKWYEIGAKYLTKRNTFSDFIASAEHLIKKGYTNPSLLACEGRSAGGLLIGAVLNMRPDLFKVAIAGVPFVDVMTTMCDPSIPLTTGEWEEWGNPNEYQYFDYMLSYSPMDNIRAQRYPHIMVQAGLHDPRVAYWEPAKWVAKLRETKTDSNELLFNIDLESGHFSAKDRYRYWREAAIQQAFVCKHLKSVSKLMLRR